MSADDSSLPTHEECALAIFSFDSDDRLALLRHLGEDDLSDRAELELGRILAFYTANAPRRLQVGLRDFRARASFPLPLALDEQQRIQRGDLPHDHWSLRAGGGDRDDGGGDRDGDAPSPAGSSSDSAGSVDSARQEPARGVAAGGLSPSVSFGTAPEAVQRRSIDLAGTPLYSGLPSSRKAAVDTQPRAGGGAAVSNVQALFGLPVPAAAPDSAGGLAAGDSFSFPGGLAASDPRGLAAGFLSPAGDPGIVAQILAALGPKIDELMEQNRSEVDAVRSELVETRLELAAAQSSFSNFTESFQDRLQRQLLHPDTIVPASSSGKAVKDARSYDLSAQQQDRLQAMGCIPASGFNISAEKHVELLMDPEELARMRLRLPLPAQIPDPSFVAQDVYDSMATGTKKVFNVARTAQTKLLAEYGNLIFMGSVLVDDTIPDVADKHRLIGEALSVRCQDLLHQYAVQERIRIEAVGKAVNSDTSYTLPPVDFTGRNELLTDTIRSVYNDAAASRSALADKKDVNRRLSSHDPRPRAKSTPHGGRRGGGGGNGGDPRSTRRNDQRKGGGGNGRTGGKGRRGDSTSPDRGRRDTRSPARRDSRSRSPPQRSSSAGSDDPPAARRARGDNRTADRSDVDSQNGDSDGEKGRRGSGSKGGRGRGGGKKGGGGGKNGRSQSPQ